LNLACSFVVVHENLRIRVKNRIIDDRTRRIGC